MNGVFHQHAFHSQYLVEGTVLSHCSLGLRLGGRDWLAQHGLLPDNISLPTFLERCLIKVLSFLCHTVPQARINTAAMLAVVKTNSQS